MNIILLHCQWPYTIHKLHLKITIFKFSNIRIVTFLYLFVPFCTDKYEMCCCLFQRHSFNLYWVQPYNYIKLGQSISLLINIDILMHNGKDFINYIKQLRNKFVNALLSTLEIICWLHVARKYRLHFSFAAINANQCEIFKWHSAETFGRLPFVYEFSLRMCLWKCNSLLVLRTTEE